VLFSPAIMQNVFCRCGDEPAQPGHYCLLVCVGYGLHFAYTATKRMVIFGVALLIALGADIAKVVLADKIRKKLTPKNIHRINQLNGIILLGFGIAFCGDLLVYGKAGGHH
jgi:hypothetical protein